MLSLDAYLKLNHLHAIRSYRALYRIAWIDMLRRMCHENRIQCLSVMSMPTSKKRDTTDRLQLCARGMKLPTGAYVLVWNSQTCQPVGRPVRDYIRLVGNLATM